MTKKTALAIGLVVSLGGCAHKAARAPAFVAHTEPESISAQGVSLEGEGERPLPEIDFKREFDSPDYADVGESACTFNVSGAFAYDGLLYFKGRPFAKGDAFGALTMGIFSAPENSLFARASLFSEHARVNAELSLPEIPLYAAGPIVHDEWLHITRTRIATKTSVRGAFFAPDVKLSKDVRLKAPLREDAYRIPCGFVTPNRPETPAPTFSGTTLALDAPDSVVGISRTPDGPPIAEIIHPSGFAVEMLGMYKTTALVAVNVGTPETDATIIGWIHQGTLEESGMSGIGEMRDGGHRTDRAHLTCRAVSVFVTVDGRLYDLVETSDTIDFYGAPAENGDFRLDLGADSKWSPTRAFADGPKEPLNAFVPKEYLARCTSVT